MGRIHRLAKRVARRVPYLGQMVAEWELARPALRFVPPGHYYSPFPALDEVRRDEARLFGDPPRELPGITLNEAGQLALLDQLRTYYAELPFPERKTSERRGFLDNPFYPYADAITLYAMIRHLRPRRIIEVGSGHSSCFILDTNELFFQDGISCTFIEPHAERLLALTRPDDHGRLEIVRKRVQDVARARFEDLGQNDILFIDSSHVSKIGSDVNYLVAEVFPALRRGVYLHIHDIFYPFEYPREWVYEGRAWTEAYLLRAFLAFNPAFDIVLFNSFLQRFHRDRLARDFPLCLRSEGGSIWLVRT